MNKLFLRILTGVLLSMLLAGFGLSGNTVVLQALFTVLGIVFSISMSLLVSFNLSRVLNKPIRDSLRAAITHTRNMLLGDFAVSTFFMVAALIWKKDMVRYELAGWCVLDVMLMAVVLVALSLVYEMYNFRQLHKLHCDIEDAVIEEDRKNGNFESL